MLNSLNHHSYKLLLITGMLLALLLFLTDINVHGCTQVAMAGPLGPGLTYIDGSDPVIFKLQNASGPSVIRYMPAGTQAGGTQYAPYTYEHSFIYMGRDDPAPYCFSTGMNCSGTAHGTQNWGGNGGADNWNTRERALAMGTGFEDYENIIRAEAYANTVVLAGPNQDNVPQAAYILQGVTHIMGQNESFFLAGAKSSQFMEEINNMENWCRGDSSLLETRDMAYIFHLHNNDAQYMMLAVPKHRTVWLSCGYPAKSPLIPFKIDDPYIHPDFQDLTYYNSLSSNPYTLSEIAEIEDAVMAPDGSVIGDIREIQMRIAKRLPIQNPSNIDKFNQSTEIPESFFLAQNYPNPFNSSTIIKYTVPISGNVALVIYDILGRKIKYLCNNPQSVGSHSIIWDGKNENGGLVSAGVYIYTLISNGQNVSRKMLLIK